MRLSAPRVPPLSNEEMDDAQREFMARFDEPVLNIFRTMIQHPDLFKRWIPFGNHVLHKSTLPPRERELAILRIGYLCRAGYEWGQHVLIGREAGLSDDEMRRIREGPDAPGWTELESLVLRATDELHSDAHITDATWKELSMRLTKHQLMDLVFAVGQYNMLSMALNSFGVQADSDLPALDF